MLGMLAYVNYIAAWKAISIVFTGGFGILALLKDYKDKDTGKITKWGAFSLAGIVLSTGCGVAVQLKESKSESEQALQLATATNKAVRDIDRQMKSLNGARLEVRFKFLCPGTKDQSPYCRLRGEDGGTPTVFTFELFEDQTSANRFINKGVVEAPVSKETGHHISIFSLVPADSMMVDPQRYDEGEGGFVWIRSYLPVQSEIQSDGEVISGEDLPGKIGILHLVPHGLMPVDFNLILQSGQKIRSDGSFKLVILADKEPGNDAYQFAYSK
jgi:hypothetical protein